MKIKTQDKQSKNKQYSYYEDQQTLLYSKTNNYRLSTDCDWLEFYCDKNNFEVVR